MSRPSSGHWPGGLLAAAPAIVDACRIVRLPACPQTQAITGWRSPAQCWPGWICSHRSRRDASSAASTVEVIDSDANFCLFGRFADRHHVWQRLLDAGCSCEIGPPYLRVSVEHRRQTCSTPLAEVLEEISERCRRAPDQRWVRVSLNLDGTGNRRSPPASVSTTLRRVGQALADRPGSPATTSIDGHHSTRHASVGQALPMRWATRPAHPALCGRRSWMRRWRTASSISPAGRTSCIRVSPRGSSTR